MKALLMHRDRDFDPQQELPWNERTLTQDLELGVLFGTMARGDEFLRDVARKSVLSGLRNDLDTILYRLGVVKDALRGPAVVRELYRLAIEAIESRKRSFFGMLGNYPSTVLHGSIEVLEAFMGVLVKMRRIADDVATQFESDGFTGLFATLRRELSDDYFASVREHLGELRFRRGVLLSAELGAGNEGTHHVLLKSHDVRRRWFEWILPFGRPPEYTVWIAERDQAGAQALTELRDRGTASVARALGESADHVLSFFQMLRTELAFYVGCLNLHDALTANGHPVCMPRPAPAGGRPHRFSGLYDVPLALTTGGAVVGNAAEGDGKRLVVVTGANQGGKSTFLRSVGLAQLMMQSGMFVGAESFEAALSPVLATHYKREEDATMKSGKLDEELARMSEIADHLAPGAMVLFNESFAATNEREGSEIARQIVSALLEKGVKIFYVTHLYDFAHEYFERRVEEAIFLRAERKPDGTRTFRIVEGAPLETSYGADLYREIFESASAGSATDGGTSAAPRDGIGASPESVGELPGRENLAHSQADQPKP